MDVKDNKIDRLIEYSKDKEDLLERVVKHSFPIEFFPNKENFLILARMWNSWYPSTYRIRGGCYFFNINEEIVVIDPGFNALEIIRENNLDIRLIRHVIVTHFHPDHFENLIRLLTRLTSPENKLYVYLNPTSFQQFKVYKIDKQIFIELKPGNTINLEMEKKDYSIELLIGKGFHREIGGYSNSIGLKFLIKSKLHPIEYKIGFMSDTDGSLNRMSYYKEFYNDCQILVPHLGAIHKEPNGNKHLYLTGIENLLKEISSDGKVIFLSEFGLELGPDTNIISVIRQIIPNIIGYNDLVRNIFDLIDNKKYWGLSLNQKDLIGKALFDQFKSYLDQIDLNRIFNSEIILPLLDLERGIQIDTNRLKSILSPCSDLEHSEKLELWFSFYKEIIFQVEGSGITEQLLDNTITHLGISWIKNRFDSFITHLIKYTAPEFQKQLLEKIIWAFRPHFELLKILILEPYENMNFVLEVNEWSDPYRPPPYIEGKHFPGFTREEIKVLSTKEGKLFISLFYMYFIVKLGKAKDPLVNMAGELEGRKEVCNYLTGKSNHLILPGHPSYRIIFTEKGIEIEGSCRNIHHKDRVKLREFNQEWELCRTDTNEEYIDVIPKTLCCDCKLSKELYKMEYPYNDQDEEEARNDYNEYIRYSVEKLIDDVFQENLETLIKDIDSLPEGILNKLDNDSLSEIERSINMSPLNSNDLTRMLLHPYLLEVSLLKNSIFRRLKQIAKTEIRNIINRLIINEKIGNYCLDKGKLYKLFDDAEFLDFVMPLFEGLEVEEKFEMLQNLIEYFALQRETKYNSTNKSFFAFFKKNFTKIFFPLILNPKDLESFYNKISESCLNYLEKLGLPFKIYATLLYLAIRGFELEKR